MPCISIISISRIASRVTVSILIVVLSLDSYSKTEGGLLLRKGNHVPDGKEKKKEEAASYHGEGSIGLNDILV